MGRHPIEREYAAEARAYDRRWAGYIRRSVRETLARLSVRPGDRVLDVACGTGELLRCLAEEDSSLRLLGVDLSPEMLSVATGKVADRAVLLRARAESLPFPANPFDAVVSTSALHHVDAPRALAEVGQALRPGGQVVITDWCDDYLACRVATFFLKRLRHGHFRTYGTAGCARLLEEAGFEEVRVERYRIGWIWGMMTAVGTKRASVAGRAGRASRIVAPARSG